jgi:hypothetical protein
MVYPPGQGKSGQYLMQLWRKYLEQYAENDGKIEDQIVVGSHYSAEILGFLALTLDREGKFQELIEQRMRYFAEGSQRARIFGDHLVNASFGIYNHLNTLCRQFGSGSAPALDLIEKIDAQVHRRIETADQIERAAAAIRAAFPLLSLMTLVLDSGGSVTPAIRQIEQRFAAGASKSKSDWDHLLNGLYRMVEMMQLFVLLSDADLRAQVDQIASRFEEEDQPAEASLKLRNGFCRLFELTHLLCIHLDEILI